MSIIENNRRFMHCPKFRDVMSESDQQKGLPHPPHNNPATGPLLVLPSFENVMIKSDYGILLDDRRSVRAYEDVAMTQQELAFMLWSVQGIQLQRGASTLRPVPSGGARHPFETYIAVKNVTGLAPGLYRYLPQENISEKCVTIESLGTIADYDTTISQALAGQAWAATSSVVLFYTCLPYRCEWRYAEASHRVMLIDLGHVGQNAMLSAEALGLGSCCMAAFDQEKCDALLQVDGLDEYTVYGISVGKPRKG